MRYFLLLLAGCAASPPEYWYSDRIVDSMTRLVYANPASHLQLEFVELEGGITAFLSLDGGAFSDSQVIVTIDNEKFIEQAHLRGGFMRLKLSLETTSKIISALKEGKEIGILGEKIAPQAFEKAYSRFLRNQNALLDKVKGPIE